MRQFRDQAVLGWKIIESHYKDQFLKDLHGLMDDYDFVDCQFSTEYDTTDDEIVYIALVLIAEKS